jgi:hypothetical protein
VVAEALRRVAGFVFRRKVCGQASTGYVRWFTFACKHVSNEEEGMRTAIMPRSVSFSLLLSSENPKIVSAIWLTLWVMGLRSVTPSIYVTWRVFSIPYLGIQDSRLA